jgi:hypothetical protein
MSRCEKASYDRACTLTPNELERKIGKSGILELPPLLTPSHIFYGIPRSAVVHQGQGKGLKNNKQAGLFLEANNSRNQD